MARARKFPKPPRTTEPQGTAVDDVFYSLEGDLIDVSSPSIEEIVSMVENDSQAQAMDLGLTLPLQRAPLLINKRKGDKGEAEWLRNHLIAPQRGKGMTTPWQQIQNQMTAAVTLKRAYWELTYKQLPDRKVVYDQVAWRPPLTCFVRVDKAGKVVGFHQLGSRPNGDVVDVTFDERTSFVYIHRADRKPTEGVSAMQTAHTDYEHKLKNLRLLHIHNQNFALGTIKGSIEEELGGDAGASSNARLKAKKLYNKLTKFQGGGGRIVVGRGENVEFMSNAGAASEFLQTIAYHDTSMVGSCLMKFLQLGTTQNVGSIFGAGTAVESLAEFYLMSLEATLADMAFSAEDQLFTPLLQWNFGANATYPEVKFGPLSKGAQKEALDLWRGLVIAANRPGGDLWDAVTELALGYLGIDPEKWRGSVQDPQNAGGPDAGADFQRNRALLRDAVRNNEPDQFTEQATAPAPGTTPNGAGG